MQSAFTQYELDPKSQQCVTIMHNNDCTEWKDFLSEFHLPVQFFRSQLISY
jgi:hypothetical protein